MQCFSLTSQAWFDLDKLCIRVQCDTLHGDKGRHTLRWPHPHPSHTAGGNSLTIKVARTGQTQQQCIENAMAAVKAAVDKVPRKWDGVQVCILPSCS